MTSSLHTYSGPFPQVRIGGILFVRDVPTVAPADLDHPQLVASGDPDDGGPLAHIDGVTGDVAQAIRDAIADTTPDEITVDQLTAVEGVGPKTAEKVLDVILTTSHQES